MSTGCVRSLLVMAKAGLLAVAGSRYVVAAHNRRAKSRVIILMYHRVRADADILGLSLSTAYFRAQLSYLRETYELTSLPDAVEKLRDGKLKESCVVITFDDGFRDMYENAFPLLVRYRIPATVFITCGAIDQGVYDLQALDEAILAMQTEELDLSSLGLGRFRTCTLVDRQNTIRTLHALIKASAQSIREEVVRHVAAHHGATSHRVMMTWQQVKDLARSDIMTIGAHTLSHPILSRVSVDRAREEIAGSKKILEQKINRPVRFFAYPNGRQQDFTEETIALVREAGFDAACTTIPGDNRTSTNLFLLHRIDVTCGMCQGLRGHFSPSMFAANVSGVLPSMLRKSAWL